MTLKFKLATAKSISKAGKKTEVEAFWPPTTWKYAATEEITAVDQVTEIQLLKVSVLILHSMNQNYRK